MKRVFSSVMVVILIVAAFAGCGQSAPATPSSAAPASAESSSQSASESPKEPEKIKFFHYIITKEAEQMFRDQVDVFNKENPDIIVELEMDPWSSYLDKLITMVSAGMAPDASTFKSMWLPTFHNQQVLLPIDSYYESWDGKEDLSDNLVPLYKSLSEDGKLYMLPFSLVTSYFTYRKDLFAEAGVEPPDTMDEFLEVCKKLTIDKDGDGKIDQYGYTMRANANGQGGWFGFAFANMKSPGFFVDGQLSYTTPEVVEGNDFFLSLYRDHKVVPPTAPNDGTNECIANIVSGKAAIMLHHVQTSKVLQRDLGENYGVFKYPSGKNGQRFTAIEENGIVIYNTSKSPDAAFKFTAWLLTPEEHRRYIDSGDTFPFLKSVMNDYMDDECLRVSMESLEFGEFCPATPYMGEWTTQSWPTITGKGLLGEITSEEMMQELADTMYGIK